MWCFPGQVRRRSSPETRSQNGLIPGAEVAIKSVEKMAGTLFLALLTGGLHSNIGAVTFRYV
jgi:hypothetical protein